VSVERALLLTDVVDSTALAERIGDVATARVWAAHDRVARDLLGVHGGREIDKTDGFLLLFETPARAVGYALAYHEAIGRLDPPLTARAGLHVGPVILTENTAADVARGAKPLEVDGLAKSVAARVMSVARGGQTLLSSPARAALGDTPLRIESHGHWRVKGVADPLELFEVGSPDALFAPPADGAKVYRVVRRDDVWLPARSVPHSLPAERDAFVGRLADLRDLAERSHESRLVTVLGTGGTGKTRLITRFAWTWLGDWSGGVWFCDLSEARDPEGIAAAVGRTLDSPARDVEKLGSAIAARGECLVLLDNFEQVARHAPATLGVWLDAAPRARFVATSREVLGLPGEATFSLAPLGASDAVALFVERARQASRNLTLTASDLDDVRTLVGLLDGLPLAIELAAARVRSMTPRAVLQRMTERFRLLAAAGGRPSRQATLRAALDWSWDLLSAEEREAFAQLAVFEGGFDLEAAEAVVVAVDAWPADLVQALVEKSLVRRVDDRFAMLISVHEYARERLAATSSRDEAERRHGEHYGRLAAAVPWHREMRGERENFAGASRRAAVRGDAELAATTALATWRCVKDVGPYGGAIDLLASAAAIVPTGERAIELALARGSALSFIGRHVESRAIREEALEMARALGSRRSEVHALIDLASVVRDLGDFAAARALCDDALTRVGSLNDPDLEHSVWAGIGVLEVYARRGAEARAALERALALARQLGDRTSESTQRSNLGVLASNEGRDADAREHLEWVLGFERETNNRRGEANTLTNLAIIHHRARRWGEAERTYLAAVQIRTELGGGPISATVRMNLGALYVSMGKVADARRWCEEALALAIEGGVKRHVAYAAWNVGNIALLEGSLDEARARFEQALAVFQHDPAVVAGVTVGLARVDGREGHPGRALERLLALPPATADFWQVQATLAVLYAERGELELARAAIERCRALPTMVAEDPAFVAAAEARVAAAEGQHAIAREALARATAVAHWAGPDTEVGRVVDETRAVLGDRPPTP
jgi:predicted ATPase/class 3 adenylate cyclase/Tfp pilus assembly protein PilF